MKMMLGFFFDGRLAPVAGRRASAAAATPDALRNSRLFITFTLIQLQIKDYDSNRLQSRQRYHTAIAGKYKDKKEIVSSRLPMVA
jgi:hypothetical protein